MHSDAGQPEWPRLPVKLGGMIALGAVQVTQHAFKSSGRASACLNR